MKSGARAKPAGLAWRMLRRDWRSGELRILVAALVIAVAAVTAINLLTDRFGRLLLRESAELIGGDLVLQSTREPNPQWLQQAKDLGMDTAELAEFSTAVIFDDEFLLASIKAVSGEYPLRGVLRIADQPYGEERDIQQPPSPGKIWVDARVLTRLNAQVGDRIGLGAIDLEVERVLTYEPDRGGNLFNLAPRILMNAADLEAADVMRPGSRIRYKYLFAGDQVDALRNQLQPEMGPGHRLMDIKDGRGRSGNAMANAEQYLGLTALLAIFLAAIAIAMAARRYSERHYDVSGMLRCIGVQQRQLTQLYLWQLAILAVLAALVGAAVGWLAHRGLLAAIQDLLPGQLPTPGLAPYLTGFATAILLMLGVALPPVLRLKSVPPLRVFRRELTPLPASGWLVYSIALACLVGMILLLFDSIGTVLLILLAAGLAIGVLGAVLLAVLKLVRRGMANVKTGRGHLLARSLRNLAGHSSTTTGQILSFGLTAMVMVILLLLRTDLVDEWRDQLPENVPNNFAFNIQPHEQEGFEQQLASAEIDARLYPIVRGRLVLSGSQSARQIDGDDDDDNDGGRELNFTWASKLPADNNVVDGQWRTESESPEVSLEEGLARRLSVEVGDEVTVDIAGQRMTATVNSLRTVEWESFSPNFYMIFQPGLLDEFSHYFLTSFRLPTEKKPFLGELIRAFPSVTIIEVDAIIEQLKRIIGQVTLMVEMMLLFVLLAGVTVLLASIHSSLDERLREGALMRAVGASRRYLRSAAIAEFALLGVLAGLLAAFGAEMACSALYDSFRMTYQSNLVMWVSLPLAMGLGIGYTGYLATRKVVEVSPRELLG